MRRRLYESCPIAVQRNALIECLVQAGLDEPKAYGAVRLIESFVLELIQAEKNKNRGEE